MGARASCDLQFWLRSLLYNDSANNIRAWFVHAKLDATPVDSVIERPITHTHTPTDTHTVFTHGRGAQNPAVIRPSGTVLQWPSSGKCSGPYNWAVLSMLVLQIYSECFTQRIMSEQITSTEMCLFAVNVSKNFCQNIFFFSLHHLDEYVSCQ